MKPIKGYEGVYFAREDGEIVSCKNGKELVLKGGRCGGYRSYSLRINGIQNQHLGHRLIAETFLENPENKPHVNHKDGNKLNNQVANLEWVTRSENSKHAYANGLIKISDEHLHKMRMITGAKKALFTKTDAENIRHIYNNIEKMTCKKIANAYGCNVTTIKKIVNGTQKVFKEERICR